MLDNSIVPFKNDAMHVEQLLKNKKRNNRCAFKSCSKKLQLYEKAIVCKCECCFCFTHRMPLSHQCSYNYNSLEEQIKNKELINNMKCVFEKVVKI